MQQFKAKFKNSPTNAPQVRSSESLSLNKDQSLSETDKVLALNNLEVDLLQRRGGQSSNVSVNIYVLNKQGEPLMPCSPRKCRILLKKGEAHVVKTNPFFVIQLHKENGNQVQQCSLGIDTGYKFIGFSVITDKKEIVAGTLELDQKTSERLINKKMYRRHRRNKLWYRKPKFNNRRIEKKWLPPSTQRRFNTHISLINKFKNILPIDLINIEIGNFDIQKIENPDIFGIQYQKGSLFEYQNIKSFLIFREQGKCQLCEKEFSKGNSSHVHHIISKNNGGTDKEKNLALLHKQCHKKLHEQKLFHLLKKNKQYKDATFMNIIRWKFREVFPECKITYGNETFVKRNQLRLEKTHYNDAFIIAYGSNQIKTIPTLLLQKHRNNRILQRNRKGFKPSIRKRRYSIQPNDIVIINNRKFMSGGCYNLGHRIYYFNGTKKLTYNVKKVKKIYHVNSIFSKAFIQNY